MDVEQRIGRIHRYGQNHTAQVYNLPGLDTVATHQKGPQTARIGIIASIAP